MGKRSFLTVIMGVVLVLIITSLPVQSQGTFGSGWTASYWNATAPTGAPNYSENLTTGLNFNWGTGSPAPGINEDNWSARFASAQLFNAGTYEFVVASDDGVRVFIDDVLVWDRFVPRTLTTDRFQQTLTAGVHRLTVEFVEFTDQAALQFQWFLVGTGDVTPGFTPGVPTPFGTPFPTAGPSGTPLPTGPQASVQGVRGLALRSGPYLGASFITTLTPGTSYTVLGRNRDEGIYNWYLLQVGSRTGWASGRYLQISGPLEFVFPTPIPGFPTPFGATEVPPVITPGAPQTDVNAIPLAGSIFDQIDDAPDIGAVAIPRAVMNVRRRPSPRVERVGSIPWGGMAQLIGRTVQAGENRWLHVRYFDEAGNTIVGWIDARWVTIRGEIYNVPVR
jgi:hypothetical protein